MLARILFNLTFLASIGMGILVSLKYGISYFLPTAFGIFFVGLMATFVIGMIIGAKDSVYD